MFPWPRMKMDAFCRVTLAPNTVQPHPEVCTLAELSCEPSHEQNDQWHCQILPWNPLRTQIHTGSHGPFLNSWRLHHEIWHSNVPLQQPGHTIWILASSSSTPGVSALTRIERPLSALRRTVRVREALKLSPSCWSWRPKNRTPPPFHHLGQPDNPQGKPHRQLSDE